MFQGNGVFLKGGQGVVPAGHVANRLQAGQFGPTPNASAPPGFVVPATGENVAPTNIQSEILPQDGSFQPASSPADVPPEFLTPEERRQMSLMLQSGDFNGVPTYLGGNMTNTPPATPVYRSEAARMLGLSPAELDMRFPR
jgi:hypothetical protein